MMTSSCSITHHYIGRDDHLDVVGGVSILWVCPFLGSLPGGVAKVTNRPITDVSPQATEGNSLSVSLVPWVAPLVTEEWEQGLGECLYGNEPGVCEGEGEGGEREGRSNHNSQ